MKLFTSPESLAQMRFPPMGKYPIDQFPAGLYDKTSIFLGGSIEMGKAVEWQQHVIDVLEDTDAVLFNPRRKEWDSSWTQTKDNPKFVEQVNWELDALSMADVRFFNIDGATLSPITLMEIGFCVKAASQQVTIIACPDEFWRAGNVNIIADRIPRCVVVKTFSDGISLLLDFIADTKALMNGKV